MPTAPSVTLTSGIKKRGQFSPVQRFRDTVARMESKAGRSGLLEALRKAGAQFPTSKTLSGHALEASSFFEDLLLNLNGDIMHDVSWNDVLLRASMLASELYAQGSDFRFDLSKLVDDMTDYQLKKWGTASLDSDCDKRDFIHPALDKAKYFLQEGDCFLGDGTLHMCSTGTTLIYSGKWRDGHLVDGTLSMRSNSSSTSQVIKRGAFAVRSVHPNAPRVLVAHGPCRDVKTGSSGLWQLGKLKKRFNFLLDTDDD